MDADASLQPAPGDRWDLFSGSKELVFVQQGLISRRRVIKRVSE